MHRDQSLRFAGFWLHFRQPRNWFTGGMIPAHCGFECGDRLCERLTLATSAAFDAGQVHHAGDDHSVRCRCNVNHAIEDWHWLGARRLAHHGVTLARLSRVLEIGRSYKCVGRFAAAPCSASDRCSGQLAQRNKSRCRSLPGLKKEVISRHIKRARFSCRRALLAGPFSAPVPHDRGVFKQGFEARYYTPCMTLLPRAAGGAVKKRKYSARSDEAAAMWCSISR